VTQNHAIQHAAGSDENNQTFEISYNVKDGDGDVAGGKLTISVNDDTPTIVLISVVHSDVMIMAKTKALPAFLYTASPIGYHASGETGRKTFTIG
jgi:hypothetical protein